MNETSKRLAGRYMVFVYADYYPGGGLSDVEFSTESASEAVRRAKELSGKPSHNENVHVFDRHTAEVIYDWNKGGYSTWKTNDEDDEE